MNHIHFDCIDSTNTWAKNHVSQFDPHQLTCITALEQTAGRGRFNRTWISPKGQNICATLVFFLPLPSGFSYVVNLGQILSLSCIAVLKKKGFALQIKWPNDLLLENKKIGGILCETVERDKDLAIILGIGLNVNVPSEILATIDQPATSLLENSGQYWELDSLLQALIEQFREDLAQLKEKGFAPFVSAYEEHLALKGEPIVCFDGVQKFHGICESINADGTLNLRLKDGAFVILSAGEIQRT